MHSIDAPLQMGGIQALGMLRARVRPQELWRARIPTPADFRGPLCWRNLAATRRTSTQAKRSRGRLLRSSPNPSRSFQNSFLLAASSAVNASRSLRGIWVLHRVPGDRRGRHGARLGSRSPWHLRPVSGRVRGAEASIMVARRFPCLETIAGNGRVSIVVTTPRSPAVSPA